MLAMHIYFGRLQTLYLLRDPLRRARELYGLEPVRDPADGPRNGPELRVSAETGEWPSGRMDIVLPSRPVVPEQPWLRIGIRTEFGRTVPYRVLCGTEYGTAGTVQYIVRYGWVVQC